jgi:hypothetical protein
MPRLGNCCCLIRMKNASWFRRLDWRIKLALGVFILCGGCYCFGVSGQILGFIPDSTEFAATTEAALTENAPTLTNTPTNTLTPTASDTSSPEPSATASPSETITPAPSVTLTASATSAPSATHTASATFTATASATITNTPLPIATRTPAPTTGPYVLYDPDKLCPIGEVETILLEILENTEGVDFVESLCIQSFGDDFTSLTATIIVYPGYIGLQIPRSLHDAAATAMDNPNLDTLIFLSDGIVQFSYIHGEFSDGWQEDPVTWVTPLTPRPRAGIPIPTTASGSRPTSLPSATSDTTQDDERDIINMIRGATDIDVVSVEIADGRANGGERIAIITYRSTAITDADLGGEWGSIFGAVYNAVSLDSIDIDAVSIIIGNQSGNAIGIVATSMNDLEAVMNNRITFEEFYRRLSITDL